MSAPVRSERITVRLRPHQKRALEAAADARRMTAAELARRAIVREARNVLASVEADDG